MVVLLFVVALLVAEAKPVEVKIGRKVRRADTDAARLTSLFQAKKIVRDASGVAVNVRDPRSIFSKLKGMNALSLRKSRSSQQSFPLRGNWTNLALWYMMIEVAPSQQVFHVQVDTGSSDLGIPDASCNCGQHLDAPFNPTQTAGVSPAPCSGSVLNCNSGSASCMSGQCGYSISYGDGSGYTALVYSTSVTFGSVPNNGIVIPSQYVGSIISEVTPNGPFEPPAVDGIAGFAQQFLSVVSVSFSCCCFVPTVADWAH